MKRVIAITGTPAVGKSRAAHKLAQELSDVLYVPVNRVVLEHKLYSGTDGSGAKIVKLKALERVLNSIAESSRNAFILFEGHLLAEVKIRNAVAIVLREHLNVLARRYRERGYSKQKMMDNLVSEATDYCGINSGMRYKKVFEFFSRDPMLQNKLITIADGKSVGKEEIELLEELKPFIEKSS